MLLPRIFTVEQAEHLKPDTHGSRRDQELFGKRSREMLTQLIITDWVEGMANHRRHDALRQHPDYFINIDGSVLSPKHKRMIVAEPIAPCLKNQLARHEQARSK